MNTYIFVTLAFTLLLSSCEVFDKGKVDVYFPSSASGGTDDDSSVESPEVVLPLSPTSIDISDNLLGISDTILLFDLITDSEADNDYVYCITQTSCDDDDFIPVDKDDITGISEDISSLSEGTYTIESKGVIDDAYSDSSVSSVFNIDKTNPTVGAVSLAASLSSNDYTTTGITYSDNSGENVVIEYCVGTASEDCSIVAKTVTADPTVSKTFTALSLPEGDVYVTTFVTDEAGNTNSAFAYYEIDTTPTSNHASFTLGYTSSSDTTRSPSISYSLPPESDYESTFTCLGTSSSTCDVVDWTNATGYSGSHFDSLSLSTGTYYVRIIATDEAGNATTPEFLTFDII